MPVHAEKRFFESWLKGGAVNMNGKSFLSSSSTLAEGLDLMAAPMEDVVGKRFPLEDEEKELKLRLEATSHHLP